MKDNHISPINAQCTYFWPEYKEQLLEKDTFSYSFEPPLYTWLKVLINTGDAFNQFLFLV